MGHIFISYSHKDTEYAHALAGDLQAHGLNVWIDERLDYGSQWPQEIQKQLDGCEAFILVMSSNSFASDWVQSELQRAKRKLKPIFPLLLEGNEPWLSVESTQYFDVRGGRLPDARFYSALKRVVTVSPHAQTVASLPKPVRNTEPVKATRSKNSLFLISATFIGILAVFGICLVAVFVYWQQRTTNNVPAPAASTQELPTNRPVQEPLSTAAILSAATNVPPTFTFVPPTETMLPTDTLVPTSTKMGANFAGEWWTNFARINLQQTGDSVSGTYVQYGSNQSLAIAGTVDGFVLTGSAAGYAIEFTMNKRGTFFSGWWDSSRHYQWCGTRNGQSLPDGCGLSGTWNVGGRTWANGSAMKLTQTGSEVQGQYTATGTSAFDGTVSGTLSNEGFTIDGTWTVTNSGNFHWNFVDKTYNQLTGYFDAPENTWCAWRNGAGNPCP